jgi:hypothetical protein
MIPRVPLREALSDPNLLGAVIGGDSWRSWRTLLIAALGEELTAITPMPWCPASAVFCSAWRSISGLAKIILDYAEACFERSPILKQLIVNRTADALELANGITLEVRPASFRKLRGPTYIAVVAGRCSLANSP